LQNDVSGQPDIKTLLSQYLGLTTSIDLGVFGELLFGTGRRLQETYANSSSGIMGLTVQFVESVDGAAWRASGGTLQPKALGPLQQLLDDLIKYGVVTVLQGFSSGLERYAGLAVDEAGRWLMARYIAMK
jgi:hypothetical protein